MSGNIICNRKISKFGVIIKILITFAVIEFHIGRDNRIFITAIRTCNTYSGFPIIVFPGLVIDCIFYFAVFHPPSQNLLVFLLDLPASPPPVTHTGHRTRTFFHRDVYKHSLPDADSKVNLLSNRFLLKWKESRIIPVPRGKTADGPAAGMENLEIFMKFFLQPLEKSQRR